MGSKNRLDKQKLIAAICAQLEENLVLLKQAALATYDAATNEESKPENEYDTRGLEASYLAGAQAKRVAEIEELIYIYRDAKIKAFGPNEPIASTALVEVALNGKNSFVFIMPKGGGLMLNIDGNIIQTVTPTSPLGEALLGLKAGEVATVENRENRAKTRDYMVLQIQ
jgi:hypothetical protein